MRADLRLPDVPAFPGADEPEPEPVQLAGWQLRPAWAAIVVGSWALAIAVVWAVVRVIVAVIRWILLFFGG